MTELPWPGVQYRRDVTLAWSATADAPPTRRLSSFLLDPDNASACRT
ncbi:hypothetical protein [Rhodococcus gordoniae]|nr:hypothetical protein [Rhodococcus gordoniae]UTT46925.1 hypothetical protein NMQ04_11425 [Rhodococcus gordoniae]